MKDLLNSVYKSNLELLRDENNELQKTNCCLIEENIILKNKIENLSKAKKPTKEQIEILKEKWNNLTNASVETNLYWIITEWEKIRSEK